LTEIRGRAEEEKNDPCAAKNYSIEVRAKKDTFYSREKREKARNLGGENLQRGEA